VRIKRGREREFGASTHRLPEVERPQGAMHGGSLEYDSRYGRRIEGENDTTSRRGIQWKKGSTLAAPVH